MDRIFLSHSSKNKDFVRPVFDYFGGDRCIFDEMTFEMGMKTIKEIFKGIDDADIFVFFISNDSLNSEWVQKEIYKAREHLNNDRKKLAQIFPIIIDDSVSYSDDRIPDFLKTGFGAYNLRHIQNYKVVCKKIEEQLIKLKMEKEMSYGNNLNFFYGRDLEKKFFKERLDERDENGKLRHIKCMVISGIDGIGRKAFARAALIDSQIIEPYYFPMSMILSKNDTIDDFIMKLSCDLGLGDFLYDDLASLGNMDAKIEILAELLNTAQKYKEQILIEDDMCIVKSLEMSYWFEKALEKIDKKITVIIITRISLDSYKYRKNKNVFQISLQNLSPSDTFGFLRGYSKICGLPFEEEDIDFFTEILTGYPLQIQYCAELAKDNGSIQYVKDNSYLVCEMPKANSAKILELVIEDDLKREYNGFLELIAQLGTAPVTLLNYIIEKNPVYRQILARMKMFTICSAVGTSGENIKLNSVIRDYVLRSNFKMTEEIKHILNSNIEEFAKKIDEPEYMNYLSFSEFSYYVKENLKKNNLVPEKFLYTTVYVKSVIELYNDSKYQRVVQIVNDMKESGLFINSDEDAKNVIQFYYCSSLARLKKVQFDSEVSYFKEDTNLYQQYNFLKGFNYRLQGDYKKAESSYLKVLGRNPRHDKARRELVWIYTNMQDYDTALDLAEQNYRDYPENLYQMQAYFDCLIYKSDLTERQLKDIEDIMETAESIHRTSPSEIYFQLKAKYLARIDQDVFKALAALEEGLSKYKESFYLYKDYFDICEWNNDKLGMEKAYNNLKRIADLGNANINLALQCREAYLNAFQGKSKVVIELKLRRNNYFTDNARTNIMNHVESILQKKERRI